MSQEKQLENSVGATLGDRIRLVRTRLRKNQSEFAQILGSQRTSVSRYEKNKVVPGIGILRGLRNLAEPEEEEAFEHEIIRQIGMAILGREATVSGTMDELEPMVTGVAEMQEWDSLIASGRKDQANLRWAASVLGGDERIDESLLEILNLWVHYRKRRGAHSVLRLAAAFLRERLEQRFGEIPDQGFEQGIAPASPRE